MDDQEQRLRDRALDYLSNLRPPTTLVETERLVIMAWMDGYRTRDDEIHPMTDEIEYPPPMPHHIAYAMGYEAGIKTGRARAAAALRARAEWMTAFKDDDQMRRLAHVYRSAADLIAGA